MSREPRTYSLFAAHLHDLGNLTCQTFWFDDEQEAERIVDGFNKLMGEAGMGKQFCAEVTKREFEHEEHDKRHLGKALTKKEKVT